MARNLGGRLNKSGYSSIYDRVKQIRTLGYDAKVEDLCLDCMLNKLSSGEYIATFKDFDLVESVGYDWDESLEKSVRKDYTDEELIKRLKKYYLYPLCICFYFRLSVEEPYHMFQCNNPYSYLRVLNFLKDKRSFLGEYDETVLLRDNIEDIEKMTGITLVKKS